MSADLNVTETLIAPGVWSCEYQGAKMLTGTCACGRYWMFWPSYQDRHWSAQHGSNPEAVRRFALVEPFDPATLLAEFDDWLDRCHEYEAAS